MVTMVTKQKIFDQLYLLCYTYFNFQGCPIPHKNFTLPGEGSHEILGPTPPRYPMWVRKPFVSDQVIPGNDHNTIPTKQGATGSKLDRTN